MAKAAEFDNMSAKERQKVADKIAYTFAKLDRNHDGCIGPEELKKLLKEIQGFSDWTDDHYEVFFGNADWNCDSSLTFEEFVDWILQIDIPQVVSRGGRRYPVYRAREITYPSGVTVPLEEVERDLNEYREQLDREGTPPLAARLRKFMRSKNYNKTLHRYFVDADVSGNGALEWNTKEIYEFAMFCFEKIDLPRMGGDTAFHNLYRLFDQDKSSSLSERECLCMMDAVLRALARMQRNTDPEPSSDEDD